MVGFLLLPGDNFKKKRLHIFAARLDLFDGFLVSDRLPDKWLQFILFTNDSSLRPSAVVTRTA